MIVAVDEAIPYAESAFAGTAEIRTFPGRKVSAADLKDAEALVVRSITQVDRSLLDGTCVRFVGTATIGMDHLDEPYLRSRGIHVTNAAGSNANSVSEYITAALLVTAERKGWELRRKSIAIVGVGHVGTRVEIKARALGMDVVLCDPPLLESTGDRKYRFLKDVLDADIVTLHTPLTCEGPYPTYHMMDERVIGRLQPHQLLINSARGPVVAGPALKEALLRKAIAGAVLDVWEGEPRIDYSLLDLVELGSPHIAGYSLDGKVRGTEMVLDELCRYFNLKRHWNTSSVYPENRILRPGSGLSGQDAIRSVVLQVYNILKDDGDLRALKGMEQEEARAGFDRLRNEYYLHPEFRHFSVDLDPEQNGLADTLQALGFKVVPCPPSAGVR